MKYYINNQILCKRILNFENKEIKYELIRLIGIKEILDIWMMLILVIISSMVPKKQSQ